MLQWKVFQQKIFYDAAGFGGNYIIVDKEHELVVVTRWIDDAKVADVLRLIIQSAEAK